MVHIHLQITRPWMSCLAICRCSGLAGWRGACDSCGRTRPLVARRRAARSRTAATQAAGAISGRLRRGARQRCRAEGPDHRGGGIGMGPRRGRGSSCRGRGHVPYLNAAEDRLPLIVYAWERVRCTWLEIDAKDNPRIRDRERLRSAVSRHGRGSRARGRRGCRSPGTRGRVSGSRELLLSRELFERAGGRSRQPMGSSGWFPPSSLARGRVVSPLVGPPAHSDDARGAPH